jgi:hypothetical protein
MWHDVFHLQVSLGEKVVRSVLVYAFLVGALRLVGKRELGQTNTLDLVVRLHCGQRGAKRDHRERRLGHGRDRRRARPVRRQ